MAVPNRSCGTCRECCVALEISEIKKPVGVYCDLLCAEGCSIYQTRPDECRKFDCLWLEGQIPRWMKPNITHVVPWRNGVKGPDGQTVPILRMSFNHHFRHDKRVMRWIKKASHKLMVVLSDRSGSSCMIDGKIQATKGHDDDIKDMKLTVKSGRIVGVETA